MPPANASSYRSSSSAPCESSVVPLFHHSAPLHHDSVVYKQSSTAVVPFEILESACDDLYDVLSARSFSLFFGCS